MLPFGHPNRDRVEPFHKGSATKTAATRSETATHPRPITDPKRAHFDPSPIPSSELAQQGPEIKPTLGGEVDHRFASGQRQTRLDGSHVETELSGPTTKITLDLALDVVGVVTPLLILIRRQSNDPAHCTRTFSKYRQGKEADATEKLPVRGLDEIAGVVPNLEGAGAAGYGRQVGVDDHRNKILDPRPDRDLSE